MARTRKYYIKNNYLALRSKSHEGHYGTRHTALWSCTHVRNNIDLSRKTKKLWSGPASLRRSGRKNQTKTMSPFIWRGDIIIIIIIRRNEAKTYSLLCFNLLKQHTNLLFLFRYIWTELLKTSSCWISRFGQFKSFLTDTVQEKDIILLLFAYSYKLKTLNKICII
jgi:hypothetical protein